jgi:hypothetical protein
MAGLLPFLGIFALILVRAAEAQTAMMAGSCDFTSTNLQANTACSLQVLNVNNQQVPPGMHTHMHHARNRSGQRVAARLGWTSN